MGLAASGEACSSSSTVTRDPVLISACSFCRVGLPQGFLPFLFSSCLPATPEATALRPHPPRTGWADLEHLSILEPVSVVGGWNVQIRVEPASCKPRGSPDGNQSRWVTVGDTGSGKTWVSGLHLCAHSLLPSSICDLGMSPPTFMQAKMETSRGENCALREPNFCICTKDSQL